MAELLTKLDEMLEWQADGTPEHITANYLDTKWYGVVEPPRQGNLKDCIHARYKREGKMREALQQELSRLGGENE